MKTFLLAIATVTLSAVLLTGCDGEKQERMEACTKARETADARLDGKASKDDFLKAKATWETLQCQDRDIIK